MIAPPPSRAALAVCASFALAIVAGPARAEPPPSDAAVSARLAWIEGVLERDEAPSRLWRSSWLGIYSGVTLVEGALLAVASTPADRINAAINAGKAGVAFTFVLVSPSTGTTAGTLLRAAPAGTPAERVVKLRRAEALLRAAAKEERDGRGWFPLIGGALLNVGGAWLSWATTHGSSGAGWFGLVSGLAAGDVQVLTVPTGAMRAWDTYARAGDGGRLGRAPSPSVGWSVAPGVGGAAIRGWF